MENEQEMPQFPSYKSIVKVASYSIESTYLFIKLFLNKDDKYQTIVKKSETKKLYFMWLGNFKSVLIDLCNLELITFTESDDEFYIEFIDEDVPAIGKTLC